jgi:hypothetical protein
MPLFSHHHHHIKDPLTTNGSPTQSVGRSVFTPEVTVAPPSKSVFPAAAPPPVGVPVPKPPPVISDSRPAPVPDYSPSAPTQDHPHSDISPSEENTVFAYDDDGTGGDDDYQRDSPPVYDNGDANDNGGPQDDTAFAAQDKPDLPDDDFDDIDDDDDTSFAIHWPWKKRPSHVYQKQVPGPHAPNTIKKTPSQQPETRSNPKLKSALSNNHLMHGKKSTTSMDDDDDMGDDIDNDDAVDEALEEYDDTMLGDKPMIFLIPYDSGFSPMGCPPGLMCAGLSRHAQALSLLIQYKQKSMISTFL